MSNKPIIICDPEVVIEKRPGPNYIRTPLSEIKKWDTAQGYKTFGGTWFNTDNKSIASEVTETIFNSRLLNKALKAEGQKIDRKQEFDAESVLHKMYSESGHDTNYFDSTQHIDKIDINSLYGAMGNRFFHQYKLENVINITLSGQHLIRYLAKNFDDFFKNEFWKDTRYFDEISPANAVVNPVVKIIETDSVIGSTLINVDGKEVTIETLFNEGSNETNRGTNLYRTFESPRYTNTLNTDFEIEQKQITHLMKHTVEKPMYEIIVDGKSVIITGDHSIMIERDQKLISIKPYEIQEGDQLITILED